MKDSRNNKITVNYEIKPTGLDNKKISKQKKSFSWLDPVLYNVGIYLMTPILLGAFIGYRLDIYLRTSPVFVIIFLILGSISSFYNFYRIFNK